MNKQIRVRLPANWQGEVIFECETSTIDKEGDELVNAFIRGFNFHAAGELKFDATAVPEKKQVPMTGQDLHHVFTARRKAQGATFLYEWEEVPDNIRSDYESSATSINAFFGIIK